MKLTIDDQFISLDAITSATTVCISNDPTFEENFSRAHTFLMNELKKGKPFTASQQDMARVVKTILRMSKAPFCNKIFTAFTGVVWEPFSALKHRVMPYFAGLFHFPKGSRAFRMNS